MLPCLLPGEHNISRKGASWHSEANTGTLPITGGFAPVYNTNLQLWEALGAQTNSDIFQALRKVVDSRRKVFFNSLFLQECAKARLKEGS